MKLLLAIDDSPSSQAAVREVAARPWPEHTRVRVLSVTAVALGDPLPPAPIQYGEMSALPLWPVGALETRLQHVESARRIAQRAVDELAQSGIKAVLRVRDGRVGDEIVAEAREWPADLILLGARRHNAFARLLWGSVATYVLRRAPCSLEIVRAPRALSS